MNLFDIAILVLLAAFLLKGLLRGLVRELCTLLGLIAGALVAFGFHADLAERMVAAFHLPQTWCINLAFIILFLAVLLFFGLVGMLLTRYVKLLYVGGLNRVIGGLLGLVQGLLILAVIIYALSSRVLPGGLSRDLELSTLAPPFVVLGEQVFEGSWKLFENI
jgi:membrane protein required for colicin V production